jgi:hypothetical protein
MFFERTLLKKGLGCKIWVDTILQHNLISEKMLQHIHSYTLPIEHVRNEEVLFTSQGAEEYLM